MKYEKKQQSMAHTQENKSKSIETVLEEVQALESLERLEIGYFKYFLRITCNLV